MRESYYKKLKQNDPLKFEEFKKKRKEYREQYYLKNKHKIAETNKKWANTTEGKLRRKNSTIKMKLKNPVAFLFRQARTRAKDKGLEFTIKQSDIVIPEYCPIMGEKLEYIPNGYSNYSPSIDRIDSSAGYTPNNIWVISSIANRMKWNATQEQLITFCKGILVLEKGGSLC